MGTIAGERITAILHFDHGVTATLLQHRFPRVDSAASGMEIYGTEGRLFWRSNGAWWLNQPHFIPDGKHSRWQALPLILSEHLDPARAADQDDYLFVEEYVQALDEGRDHACSGGAAQHVIEIMMGIFESAAYGVCVELPQTRRDHPLLRFRTEAGLGVPEEKPRPYEEWLATEDRRLGRY
jgi:predicted dehydrogenase